MATTERTYTIPLRKEYMKAPMYRRAKKAVNAVRTFMKKHMKCETILIGPKLNLKIWEHGIKNPPHRVKVTAVKDDKEDTARVELFGFEFKPKEKKEKKEKKPAGIAGKIQEKLAPKHEEAPKAEVTTKKDIKEVKKGVEKKEEKKEKKVEAAPNKEAKPKEEKA
ncbi:60S ribosomal protein L31 [Candidatus Woesearchaeota archaeon]|nr:60S ribosomal protein L31 [Candidatus Woesearchaeota archaeon]